MDNKNFLAFDLGATSGRAVLATFCDGNYELREIHRFPNAIMSVHDKYYWNIFQLYEQLKQALIICGQEQIKLDSIGIDTWGVDFGYIASDGTILSLPRAYRDPYTDGVPERVFEVVPSSEIYDKTGIQFMNFNSLYQLYAAKGEESAALKNAEQILFIPDLLSYMLTGKRVCEYTCASTSQMLNPRTKCFETAILDKLGIDSSLLGELVEPGYMIGTLTPSLAAETGVGEVPVVAVAGHDTASAVVAVAAKDKNFAYLSSGTWSLMGIEVDDPIIDASTFEKNFTNEGGIEGTTRFLKNITGMWILEQCRKEWSKMGVEYSYPEIVKMALSVEVDSLFNPDDASFANPESMLQSIKEYLAKSGQKPLANDSEIVRCIFNSLANRYREVMEMLKEVAPFEIKELYVIGGGVHNELLNQLTANAVGIPVVAGSAEATALGNIMMQAKAAGLVEDRWQMRKMLASNLNGKVFMPESK